MSWNYLQVEVIPDDAIVRPLIGPGGLSRQGAHREIASILRRLADIHEPAVKLVKAWHAGAVDDTVFYGPFTWAIYEADDPQQGAREWIDGYIATLRAQGIDVGVAW
ncbi:hypothetical protein [Microbacterium sp. No. 7]|uniref:hypothetical protein n=1 Tax=Microbacterium sp. No. 7 TaxID=1714373 RepID=UPI0006D17366|nr:hypothetical protein [Microbacterium sp. No. 7]ALJ20365.1 hypothetical protein AOA12_10770 [Microbacterium sp. No. 7]